ncbi:MAG: ABC transporter ATP-binding protein [Clostridia bacterium]
MISLKNVTKKFGENKIAVNNISIDVKDGEIFGFLGPNGAGKSTTIKMITGILAPDSGDVLLNGIDIKKDPLKAKELFGYVSDDPNILLKLKGIQYLTFLAGVYGVPADVSRERIMSFAKKLEIDTVLGDRIESYSHGMRQKIMLIGALVHNPKLWILDEPMTGLDPKSAFLLKNMMREHADNGNTVLFSTHVLDVAEKVCDRVAIIDKGNILFCGSLSELKNNLNEDKSLEQLFLELTSED